MELFIVTLSHVLGQKISANYKTLLLLAVGVYENQTISNCTSSKTKPPKLLNIVNKIHINKGIFVKHLFICNLYLPKT